MATTFGSGFERPPASAEAATTNVACDPDSDAGDSGGDARDRRTTDRGDSANDGGYPTELRRSPSATSGHRSVASSTLSQQRIPLVSVLPVSARGTTFVELLLFFCCGLGSSLCYIATLSSLVYFMMMYGPDSYVFLNLAVYVPLVPVTVAQALWDQEFDKIFRSYRTYLFRGIIGFAFSIAGTVVVPYQKDFTQLIAAAALQGIGGAILLGTLNQMASFVEVATGRCKAAVSAGVQASALVVLVVSLMTDFGSDENDAQLHTFYFVVLAVESVCFVAFLTLMTTRPPVTVSMLRRDASILALAPLLGSDNNDSDASDDFFADEGDFDPDQPDQEAASTPLESTQDLTYMELLRSTHKCCLILLVTLIPSFLVGSWFTQVKTDWMQLPQILFYTRIASDFVGRIATVLVPPTTVRCLGWTSTVRLAPVVLFFTNAATPQSDDRSTIVLVSVIAFLSGYLVTGCFQLSPGLIEANIRNANVSKQASLLNVAFSVSALGGLLASFTLIAAGY